MNETLRCAWCVWQSRGLTCLSSFCATGEIAHGRRAQLSAACLRAQVTPGRRLGRWWLTRKTQAAAHTHSCSVSLRALLCCALRVARSTLCVVRVAVAWSDVSVFFLRDGGDCTRSSSAAQRCLPFPKGTIRVQPPIAPSSSGTLVCGSRAVALPTHGTTL